MPIQLLRRSFTVAEYHRMAHAGILSEDDRVELIEGEIVEMAPISSRHAACVARLTSLFYPLREQSIVWVQNPIRLGEQSELQPDLTLLRPRDDFYAAAHPGPEDILLVVEVVETSAAADREVKVPLYARAGIPEVWLLDLAARCLEVYRYPSAQGYQHIQRLLVGSHLSPQAFPAFALAVDDIIG